MEISGAWGWVLLVAMMFFSFSGGYIIRGLVEMAVDRTKGDDNG